MRASLLMMILATASVGPIQGGMPAAQTSPAGSSALRLVRSVALAGVTGRFGQLAIDRRHRQLFVAATGNNTVEVVDLAAGTRTRSVTGFFAPQGVAYLPEQDLVVVANGGTGLMQFLRRESFKPVDKFKFSDDAGTLRHDAAGGRLFVAYGDGGIAGFDARTRGWVQDFSLGGHPGGFQVEGKGNRIFLNVPESSDPPHVAVLLRRDPRPIAIMATWYLDGLKKNFPMALDEQAHRLFVGCHEPATLAVLDDGSGEIVDRVPIDGDAGDIFHDASARRLYISCGAGYLNILQAQEAGRWRVIERLPTWPGARTGLFVPQDHQLYLAVPRQKDRPAEIRIYETMGP